MKRRSFIFPPVSDVVSIDTEIKAENSILVNIEMIPVNMGDLSVASPTSIDSSLSNLWPELLFPNALWEHHLQMDNLGMDMSIFTSWLICCKYTLPSKSTLRSGYIQKQLK